MATVAAPARPGAGIVRTHGLVFARMTAVFSDVGCACAIGRRGVPRGQCTPARVHLDPMASGTPTGEGTELRYTDNGPQAVAEQPKQARAAQSPVGLESPCCGASDILRPQAAVDGSQEMHVGRAHRRIIESCSKNSWPEVWCNTPRMCLARTAFLCSAHSIFCYTTLFGSEDGVRAPHEAFIS